MTLRRTTAFGKHRLANHASAALLGTVCAICVPGAALADNRQYNIPAGSLATTLNKLAETGGLQLVYDTAIAGGLQSKGLNGKYSPETALQQLLGNSGLSYLMTGNNTVVIEKLPPSSKQEPTTLPKMNVVGKRNGDNYTPVDLPGYATMDAMAAYTVPVGKTRLTTQVNLNNLLDKGYYTGAGYGRNSINTGEPLSVMGSLRLQF